MNNRVEFCGPQNYVKMIKTKSPAAQSTKIDEKRKKRLRRNAKKSEKKIACGQKLIIGTSIGKKTTKKISPAAHSYHKNRSKITTAKSPSA